MKPYPDYVREHWIYEGENQPIGLILCSERNQSVMLLISEAFVGLGAKNLWVLKKEQRKEILPRLRVLRLPEFFFAEKLQLKLSLATSVVALG